MVVERLITRAKNAVAAEGEKKNVFARRMIARYIKDREVVKELFAEIAPKVANRPGGYTRVVKLGQRHGDGAEVAVLELVDYNTGQETTKAKKSKKESKKEAKKKRKETATEEKEEMKS